MTSRQTSRPRLRPGLRRAWRDPTTLQVGLTPDVGAVLSGLRAGDEAVIAALDGAHDLDQLRAVAAHHQVGQRRVSDLIELLERADLLVSATFDRVHLSRLGPAARARLAPDVAAWSMVHRRDGLRLVAVRRQRRVVVEGAGRVGSALAAALAGAGVGRVDLLDAVPVRAGDLLPAGAGAADVGRSWAQTHAQGRARLTDEATSTAGGEPDLVVVVTHDVLDARVGDDLVRGDLPHLGVVVGGDRVVIGPLVLPGYSACWRCLDLRRRDRDPAWPHLLTQLISRGPGTEPLGETALATAAAGLAALQVLTQLDGVVEADAVGRTLEVSLPQGEVRRRVWRRHAGCGCARLPDHSRTGSPQRGMPQGRTMAP